ncbi:MAG: hypothetical protein PGN25_22905 [Methylorubrum populi]
MAAFDKGFDAFRAEQDAENTARQRDAEAKRAQVGILFDILNASSSRLHENHLSPIVREGELFLMFGENEFAKISPAASGDEFKIKVGSQSQSFSGDAEGCIEELGKMVAKAILARNEAERKARLATRRRPSRGGWMSN